MPFSGSDFRKGPKADMDSSKSRSRALRPEAPLLLLTAARGIEAEPRLEQAAVAANTADQDLPSLSSIPMR
jgi:hypothetical protein